MGQCCNVCGGGLCEPIYLSGGKNSVTSLCEIYPGATEVFFCEVCGHIQTSPVADIDTYYAQEYKILLDSEEEDQIYQVVNGVKIYRTDHQVTTFFKKMNLPENALVLDYGCAKSATLRKIYQMRPDILPHLYDVSEMYIPFWEKFVNPDNWAIHVPKKEWVHRFDVVTSFFSLEHVAEPDKILANIRALLKPAGTLYCVVPNVFDNIADFVVVDHVNHFTPPSLTYLLERAGFKMPNLDGAAHYGAYVVTARQEGVIAAGRGPDQAMVEHTARGVRDIAGYWGNIANKVREFEVQRGNKQKVAIYGSGFYGTFIATCLRDIAQVTHFVDQNPFRQGKTLLGKPIIPPEALPPEIDTVYVGLNPRIARSNIADVAAWAGRTHSYFYF